MSDFETLRRMMVDTQVRPSDVTKYPIIEALLSVRREAFVPTALRDIAYSGEELSLGNGRAMLEPRTLAKMLDALNIQPTDLVLEVGTGLGYSAAVIGKLADAVITVEEDAGLAADAAAALSDEGIDNAVVVEGALKDGAAKHGPYDVIVVQGGIAVLSDTLADQLKEDGRIAAVFMNGALGEVRLGLKQNGRISWRLSFNAGAPVLPGFAKEETFSL